MHARNPHSDLDTAPQITMEMFFRDMRCAALEHERRELRFKIDHPLCHYGKDYSFDDPSHFVVIRFSSDLDMESVKRQVAFVHGTNKAVYHASLVAFTYEIRCFL